MARNLIERALVLLCLLLVGGCSASSSSTPSESGVIVAAEASAVDEEQALGASPVMSGASACDQAPAVADLMGLYRVMSVERFRGGLTTREEALARVGAQVLLSGAEFRIDSNEVASPQYKLVCHQFSREEGEVPTTEERLLSTFYGYGRDREVVWELEISAEQGSFYYAFEVVQGDGGTELWDLNDGWIYFMHSVADEAG